MSSYKEMISTHPKSSSLKINQDILIKCIQECLDCAQACVTCSDACLAENNVETLRSTIRSTADCADICISTGKILSRLNEPDWSVIKAQINACAAYVDYCGMQCNEHRHHHKHCAVCADSCKACSAACNELLKQM